MAGSAMPFSGAPVPPGFRGPGCSGGRLSVGPDTRSPLLVCQLSSARLSGACLSAPGPLALAPPAAAAGLDSPGLVLRGWQSRRFRGWQSRRLEAAQVVRSSLSPQAAQEAAVPSLDELRQLAGPLVVPHRLSHAKERVFDSPGRAPPELLLYRDDSAWCPYCERVWLQLEEKQIPYRVQKINLASYGPKPDWFLKMVPSGLLPVIEFRGEVVVESLDIMLRLEEAFSANLPLLPSEPSERARALELMETGLQPLLAGWFPWLRAPVEPEGGGAGYAELRAAFERGVQELEDTLAQTQGPFFLGPQLSLVDVTHAPLIERVAALVAYFKGVEIRYNPRWPRINAWMDAMDARPAYRALKSDDFTLVHSVERGLGPFTQADEGSAYRAKIDGRDGSWDLPLQPEYTQFGFDDGTGTTSGAKEEAAQALVGNHDAVVAFAMRALDASPKDASFASAAGEVSSVLRHTAHALLRGHENVGPLPALGEPNAVAKALAYLRDRVSVPRDLTHPAARQLRAHLNWAVRSLGSDL